MLIQFSVKNFLSFRDEAVLSMVKGNGSELPQNTFDISPMVKNTRLLRSAAIYGANGSGKTNFIVAMRKMKSMVGNLAATYDGIAQTPFSFDADCAGKPTELEVIFITKGVRYQYGFCYDKERVSEEWLFAFPNGKTQEWFVREGDNWRLGEKLKGQKNVWKKATRPDALFLSTAVALNSTQLLPVHQWFGQLHFIKGSIPTAMTSAFVDRGHKQEVLDYLKGVDMDVTDLEVQKQEFEMSPMFSSMPEPIQKIFSDEDKKQYIYDEFFVYHDKDGNIVRIPLKMESAGTIKMYSLAHPLLATIGHGGVLVVDDLGRDLHPRLVAHLVKMFNSSNNKHNAQLVMNTHETSLIGRSKDLFRRDQIWFCEKDRRTRNSTLYPLSDFRLRAHTNNEAAYLSGVFGAVPIVVG